MKISPRSRNNRIQQLYSDVEKIVEKMVAPRLKTDYHVESVQVNQESYEEGFPFLMSVDVRICGKEDDDWESYNITIFSVGDSQELLHTCSMVEHGGIEVGQVQDLFSQLDHYYLLNSKQKPSGEDFINWQVVLNKAVECFLLTIYENQPSKISMLNYYRNSEGNGDGLFEAFLDNSNKLDEMFELNPKSTNSKLFCAMWSYTMVKDRPLAKKPTFNKKPRPTTKKKPTTKRKSYSGDWD
jgi:hypothetical protein